MPVACLSLRTRMWGTASGLRCAQYFAPVIAANACVSSRLHPSAHRPVSYYRRYASPLFCQLKPQQALHANIGSKADRREMPGSQAATAMAQSTARAPRQLHSQVHSPQQHRHNVPNGASLPADAIPLQLRHECIMSDAAGVIMDNLPAAASVNAKFSEQGALVLGMASTDGVTHMVDMVMGQLKARRMIACARNKLWWMTPEWRTSTRDLPPETQFLLLELKEEGAYGIVLPLIDGDFRGTLRAPSQRNAADGDIILRIESGDARVKSDAWSNILYVGAGWDPYQLIHRGVSVAAQLSGGARPRVEKQLPPSLDVFGWCTWDAFYSTVSAKGLQEGLESLHKGGIPPKLIIIDDGWQSTDVDPAHRKPPMSELAERMHMPAKQQEMIHETEEEFYQESMEVLAGTVAPRLPSGTSAGTVMPTLSNLGQEGAKEQAQHIHHELPHSHSSDKLHHRKGHEGQATKQLKAASGTSSGLQQQQQQQPVQPEVLPAERDSAKEEETMLLVRLGQKLAGWVIGVGTAAFLIFYQWVVEPAPPGSWPVKFFTWAAQGALRPAMLAFYATASDFTRRLTSVKANSKFSSPDAGPELEWQGQEERLGEVVAELKRKFGLQHVYCWHGLPAYWAGVMPDAPDTQHYNASIMYAQPTPGVLEIEPSMAWNPAVLAGVGVLSDPFPLYNAMHNYLSKSGVDGVKVDCQAGVGLVGSALGGGPALSRKFHAALEESIATNFRNNQCINCMCHSTENLYRMTNTSIARASDDFYPRDPASSLPHIAACAYNSLFLSVLVQPDWDMFQSKHPAAQIHAMARVVSGGAVYVSDKPGEHDFDLLRRLVLPDGSILRGLQPGLPTRDTLFRDVLRDGQSVLKVWNVNSHTGFVGVFNLQGSSWDRTRRKFFVHNKNPPLLMAQVRPKDVEAYTNLPAGSAPDSTFVAWSFVRQQLVVLRHQEAVEVPVTPASSDIITLAPITEVEGVSFAPVGLTQMYNSGGAVKGMQHALTPAPASASQAGNKLQLTVTVTVKGHGEFTMYSSRLPASITVDGQATTHMGYDAGSCKMQLMVPLASSLLHEVKVAYSL